VACGENLPLVWLAGMIAPDHNSLWRFWHGNQKALRQIFKQSAQLALRTGAVGLVLQALDGTKIQAVASGYSGWSKEYMEKILPPWTRRWTRPSWRSFRRTQRRPAIVCRRAGRASSPA